MKLHELQATEGSRFEHYRKGRGLGSEKLLVKVTKVKTPVVVAVLP